MPCCIVVLVQVVAVDVRFQMAVIVDSVVACSVGLFWREQRLVRCFLWMEGNLNEAVGVDRVGKRVCRAGCVFEYVL